MTKTWMIFIALASGVLATESEKKAPENPSQEQLTEKRDKAHTHILTNEQLNAIVRIERKDGSGTGFIGKFKNILFVFTNRHVIEGADVVTVRTYQGETIRYNSIFFAIDHDIAMLRLSSQDTSIPFLTISEDPTSHTNLGKEIVVPGDSLGSGVFLQSEGKVIAFGPNRIEHNAPVFTGNSGSPIILKSTMQVIGVDASSENVARKMNWANESSVKNPRSEVKTLVRTFGYRIDTVKEWVLVDLKKFNEEIDKIKEIGQGIMAVQALIQNNPSGYRNDQIIIKAIDRLRDDTTTPGHRLSDRDIEAAHRRFQFSIKSYIGSLGHEATKYQTHGYEFNRDKFTNLGKIARETAEKVNQQISRSGLMGIQPWKR